ncbi:MAG: MarR family transcriptional regulator [Actinobacteria bacterium]|nr:MarR family transcriptional regulator [Actinomycetota bacterium]
MSARPDDTPAADAEAAHADPGNVDPADANPTERSARVQTGAEQDPPRDQAVIRVEQELGRLFARIRVSWREAAAIVHPDLQPLGYQMLTAIESGRATTAGEIGKRLQTDKSAVSRLVRQLEELGLVESIPDAGDRRARRLVATPLAQERVAQARSAYESRIADRLRRWTAADLEHFAELLGDLG